MGPPLRLSDRLNIKELSVAERIQLVEEAPGEEVIRAVRFRMEAELDLEDAYR